MSVVALYVSAAQLVLQSDAGSCEYLELNRLLPHIRQLLSCVVCCHLVQTPQTPISGRCQHNVCRQCVRGRKSIRPACASCKDCQDYKSYGENRQIRCLLLCYKSLCEHIMESTQIFSMLSKHKMTPQCSSVPGLQLPHMSTQEFILEGARYEEAINSYGLDIKVTPRLFPTAALTSHNPPNSSATVAPLAPVPAMHMLAHSHAIHRASTSPISTPFATPPPPPPPPPLIIKQEHNSTPPLPIMSTHATLLPPPPTTTQHIHQQSQPLTLKHLKSIVDLSAAVQLPTSAAANTMPVATPHPTITYVRANTMSIGSSSITTTAPLSIASAKLQSLNRQRVRNASLVSSIASSSYSSATTSSGEVHPPLSFKVSLAPSSSSSTQPSTVSATTATITSQQIRNPPPIKTVSNGSAMYSVLYTGIGNKITIKRKTDGDEDNAQRKNTLTSTAAPAVFRQLSTTKLNPKRRGCRCGNATPTPGKLTCCGQRCPCYVDSKSCIGCKCRGCRNPHRPDGGKVRPVIPELACYEIQMVDDNSSLSPHELPIATATTTTTSLQQQAITATATSSDSNTSLQHHQQIEEYVQQTTPQISMTPTSSAATLIPFRNYQQMSTNAQQQQQQQQQQSQTLSTQQQPQTQQTSNNNNLLQLENMQRESVLIQNAEGKYQVVNVFTSGPHNQNASNQISSLQRIHTISQLQQASNSSSSINSNASHLPTVSSTFILPNATSCSSAVAYSSAAVAPITTTTTHTLPQIIMQHQQKQQQTQQQQQSQTHIQRIISNSSSSSTITSNSLPLQLQQQLKQNNIITVHPINSNHATNAPATQPPTTTITLSPIIVTSSPNTFTPDMFSDSSDEFLSINNGATNAAHIITMPQAESPHTQQHLSFVGSSGGSSTLSSSATSAQMVEIIESNDLRLLSADGFSDY